MILKRSKNILKFLKNSRMDFGLQKPFLQGNFEGGFDGDNCSFTRTPEHRVIAKCEGGPMILKQSVLLSMIDR